MGSTASKGEQRTISTISRLGPTDVADWFRTEVSSLLELLQQLCAVDPGASRVGTDQPLNNVRMFLEQHADLLPRIACAISPSIASRLVLLAAESRNIDVLMTLLEAGMRPQACYDIYADVLHSHVHDINGNLVRDEYIAACFTRMHALSVTVPARRYFARCSMRCLELGLPACLAALIAVDPGIRLPDGAGKSLLHLAAGAGQASICSVLLEAGWRVTDREEGSFGLNACGACWCSDASVDRMCSTFVTLTRGMEDVTDAVKGSGLCDGSPGLGVVAAPFRLESAGVRSTNAARVRIHVYICAAVGDFSCVPRMVLRCRNASGTLDLERAAECRSIVMDEHVQTCDGRQLYIPSALRVTGDASRAVRFAVVVDVLCFLTKLGQAMAERWTYIQKPMLRDALDCVVAERSDTIRAWAWHRRVQAAVLRRKGAT